MEKSLKETIKHLAAQQVLLRNQRKTVHIVGERTLSAKEATNLHSSNRFDLRLLYATQQLLKGVPLEDIEKNNHPSTIPLTSAWLRKELDKLIAKYATVVRAD